MLETSGEWLQVSWTGVYTPSYWDFVALMVPANASVRTTAPAKYKMTRFAETSPEGTPFLRFVCAADHIYRRACVLITVLKGRKVIQPARRDYQEQQTIK